MAYIASVRGRKGRRLYVYVNGVKVFHPADQSYLLDGKYAYSFRTGRRDQYETLQLGENQLPQRTQSPKGLVSYLDAEKTAIRELNAEISQSSVLGEGTWGLKDAGHVFSTFQQLTRHGEYSFRDPREATLSGRSFALLSPFVDPVTYDIMKKATFRWPNPGVIHPLSLTTTGVTKDDLYIECAQKVLDSSPDTISGAIGETLVEFSRLPMLLKRAQDIGRQLGDLQKTWGRLSETVKKDIDMAFRDPLYASARLTGESSSAYLHWSFALRPLIEDIKLLLEVAAHMSGSIQQSTKRVRKTNEKRSYEGNWAQSPSIISHSFGYVESSGIWPSTVNSSYVVSYDVLIHSKWRRVVGSDNGFLAKANDLNKQLGVIYPSLMWDIIPWSFLIDWFLHIGASIDRASALTNGQYQLDYSWATVRGHSGVFIDGVVPFRNSYPEVINFSGVRPAITTFQSRFPVDPRHGLKPKWAALSGDQQLLTAALGFSRLK